MSLAENHVISNQLQGTVVGKRITNVVANQNPHSFVWFATERKLVFGTFEVNKQQALLYPELLTGKVIEKSEVHFGSYGTYNFLYVGDRALMFGIPAAYYAPGAKLPKRHQLLLTFDDGSSLAMCGSLGGTIYLLKIDEDGLAIDYKPPNVPDLLTDAFTSEYFLDLIRRTELKSLSAKAFLATQNRIPGLDNYILHEILWEAGVNPKSKMVSLEESDFMRIYEAIRKVFPAVIVAGGLDTQKDLFGQFGGYVTRASRNTLGMPCVRCGGIIVREAYLGGAVFYCPECQALKAPSK